MRRTLTILAMSLALGPALAPARGQAAADPPDPFEPLPLRPLDQSIGDVGPLSLSLRQVERGLRRPTNFEQVYRVPGREDLLMRVNGGIYAVFPRSQYARSRRGEIALIPTDTVFYIGEPALPPVTSPGALPGRDELDTSITAIGLAPTLSTRTSFERAAVTTSAAAPPGPTRPLPLPPTPNAPGTWSSPAVTPPASPAASPVAGAPAGSAPSRRGPRYGRAVLPEMLADARYRAERVRGLMRRAADAELTGQARSNAGSN